MEVLVIGAHGYIGSRLIPLLLLQGHVVHRIDAHWFGTGVAGRDYANLHRQDVANCGAVVLLAGHSSVAMSVGKPAATFHNNVVNALRLLDLLRPDQRLIYFSSSSVYGQGGSHLWLEHDPAVEPINEYDASKRALDWAMLSQRRHANWVGLRCATVCGAATHLRTDTMLNAMVGSAVRDGHIWASGDACRPIISVWDVARAVAWLLESGKGQGLYNLSSLNTTVQEAARAVADYFGVVVVQAGEPTSPYDFSVSNARFVRDTGFEFQNGIEGILDSLASGYELASLKTDRRQPRNYP